MTTQNSPRDERHLLRVIAALEKRIRALETAPRAAKTSFSNGKLTVGDPASNTRIEISAAERRITFYTPEGPATLYVPPAEATVVLTNEAAAGAAFTFGTRNRIQSYAYGGSIQSGQVASDGTETALAEIDVEVADFGNGATGVITILANGVSDHNNSMVQMFADGGVSLYTNSRTTDPPAPPGDTVVLYVKGNRLYYRDGAGAVHGPL